EPEAHRRGDAEDRRAGDDPSQSLPEAQASPSRIADGGGTEKCIGAAAPGLADAITPAGPTPGPASASPRRNSAAAPHDFEPKVGFYGVRGACYGAFHPREDPRLGAPGGPFGARSPKAASTLKKSRVRSKRLTSRDATASRARAEGVPGM